MARRPRIEIAGYYHIINRGVEQRVIFKEASDFTGSTAPAVELLSVSDLFI